MEGGREGEGEGGGRGVIGHSVYRYTLLNDFVARSHSNIDHWYIFKKQPKKFLCGLPLLLK